MKRWFLAALAAASVLVPSASSATVTMAITANGYVPKTLTIVTGDSVTFANQDRAAHQVVLKPASGFTCTASLVIQPAQSSTCTFRTVTKYAVSDPNVNRSAFKGTITVKAGPPGTTLSLTASPKVVTYGGQSTLSGQLATGQANQNVDMLGQECGVTAMRKLTTVTTTAGGAYTLTVQPHKNTTYESRFKSSASAPVLVKVKPKLTLRKVSRGRYSVRLFAADSFAGHVVVFQRYQRSTGRWIRVRLVTLSAAGMATVPINPTTVSGALFRARIKARLRVRVVLTQAQAGSCYAATRSAVIRS